MKITLSSQAKLPAVTNWITKHVGPMEYYLHNKMGGSNWRYDRQSRVLEVDNDKQMTMMLLRLQEFL